MPGSSVPGRIKIFPDRFTIRPDVTYGLERQPWFYAVKLSLKPIDDLESASISEGRWAARGLITVFRHHRGLVGGNDADNSNGLAGFEARTASLGCETPNCTASFPARIPPVSAVLESYLAGFYIPALTADGKTISASNFSRATRSSTPTAPSPRGTCTRTCPSAIPRAGPPRTSSSAAATG